MATPLSVLKEFQMFIEDELKEIPVGEREIKIGDQINWKYIVPYKITKIYTKDNKKFFDVIKVNK
jgi:hypothetical protein